MKVVKSFVIFLLCLFCMMSSISATEVISADEPTFVAMGSEVVNNGKYYGYHDLAVDASRFVSGDSGNHKGTVPSSFSLESSVVKSQDAYDACWAFAAVASGESSIMDKHLTSGEVDLSELQLAYFFYNRQNGDDPLGLSNGDRTNALERSFMDNGGNNFLTSFALAGAMGMVVEGVLPYEQAESVLTGNVVVDRSYGYESNAYRVDNIKWLDISDVDTLKSVLMNDGAIAIGYYHDDKYYNSSLANYYNNTEAYSNHAVVIVGWDDNYSAQQFKNVPSKDGAWLVKNSWGSSWGDDGYFWLSYEDVSIQEGVAVQYDLVAPYGSEKVYQYDGSTGTYVNAEVGTVKGANVYTATRNEILQQVGFYTDGANVSYKVDVYTNVGNRPTKGTKVASVSGRATYAGYITVDTKPIYLKKGQTFSVVVTLTADDKNSVVCMYVDRPYEFSWIEGQTSAKSGQSYVTDKDGVWTNISADKQTNVRIKAYTSQVYDIKDQLLYGYYGSSTDVVIEEGIVGIVGVEDEVYGVFYNKQLTSVVLPTTLKSIGKYAFDSNDLCVVSLPDGIASIENYAFTNNDIKSLYLPSSLESIGNSAFDDGVVFFVDNGSFALQWAKENGYDYEVIGVDNPIIVDGVKLNYSSVYKDVNESVQLEATFTPSNANVGTQLSWESSDTSVASVDNNGLVTIIGVGTSEIKVTTVGGYSAVCEVGTGFGATVLKEVKMASKTSLKLSWAKTAEADGYVVYRSTDNKNFSSIATVTTNSYTNKKLTVGKNYYYKVKPYRLVNNKKVYADASNVVRGALLTTAAITVKGVEYDTVKVSWKKVKLANAYEVYRSLAGNDNYELVSTVTTTSFVDSGLSLNTKYSYKVKAISNGAYGAACSALSNSKTITTVLSKPKMVSKDADVDGNITITWSSVSGANVYEVYRASSKDGKYKKVSETEGTMFVDEAKLGKTYYYKVRAKATVEDKVNYSSYSSIMKASSVLEPEICGESIGYNEAKISWILTGATGYKVYQATSSSGKYSLLATLDGDTNTYIKSGLTAGKTYYYKVLAFVTTSDGVSYSSPYSNVEKVIVTPQQPQIELNRADNGLNISWNKVKGASGYTIYRSTSENGTYKEVKSVGSSVVSYVNTGLSANKKYYYKVKSYSTVNKKKVYSDYSNVVSDYPNPNKVQGLSVVTTNEYQNKLIWDEVSYASYYEIYRKAANSDFYSVIARVPSGTLMYYDHGVSFYDEYSYKIRAVRFNGNEAYVGATSNAVVARTMVRTPIAASVNTYLMNALAFEFKYHVSADGVEVYRKAGSKGKYTLVGATENGNVSYYEYDGNVYGYVIDENLVEGTTYYYRVRAYKLASDGSKIYSDYSNVLNKKMTGMQNIGGKYPKTIKLKVGYSYEGKMKTKGITFNVKSVNNGMATVRMKISYSYVEGYKNIMYFGMVFYTSDMTQGLFVNVPVEIDWDKGTQTYDLLLPLDYVYYHIDDDYSATLLPNQLTDYTQEANLMVVE